MDNPTKDDKTITLGDYKITEHPPLPDGRQVIWIQNTDGEGMTVDVKTLDKIWDEYF